MKRFINSSLILLLFSQISYSQKNIKSPEEFFGFYPGSDRNLFNYEQLIDYLQLLDQHSDRLVIREVGRSPMGKPMYIAFFSSAKNLERLDELKEINKELAINPELSNEKKEELISKGRVFVMATLSMHSGEVGPAQSAPVTAFELCTTQNPSKLEWLDNVVYMMIPNHNPDGMNMIVDYYLETKGTRYEGATQPGMYHKYVGHDNNRDFVILSQEDTKVIAKIYNTDWYPQVFVEKHQMGSTGTRYFVPPNHDPIAENIDEGIWNWTGIFGANLIKDMTREDLSGVSQHYLFDDYWPGSTETCIWKNVIGFLTECASVKYATPVYIEPTELRVQGKGLSEYKKSINMPDPWPGGWWRLSDIVTYEIVSVESILKTASTHKNDILKFRNDLCEKQVELGKTQPPYYYILPLKQHDQSELVNIVNLMMEHGVDLFQLDSEIRNGNHLFEKGDIVIPLSQPYRAFIKEVMEKQEYPVRRYTPGGEIIKPYDITSWSLPLHNGVKSFEINEIIEGIGSKINKIQGEFNLIHNPENKGYAVFPVNRNESFKIAFTAVNEGIIVERLIQELEAEGIICPPGSFVIKLSDNEKMKTIRSLVTVDPVYVNEKPEAGKFEIPSIGLVESWFHDMDAGWTRFVFDSYKLPYKVIRPGDFEELDYSEFDIIVFPDENKSILMNGRYKSGEDYYLSSYAPEYTKGMGKKGLEKLMIFINEGGRVVSWGESTGLFEGTFKINEGAESEEEFQLPFRDISENLRKDGVYCPGSLVKMQMDLTHPLTAGMPGECGIFYRGRPLFATSVPNFDMDRRVIGIIPEKEILMSGYCENEEKIGNKAVMIWLSKGKGDLILMGFNPQFRASTHVSYKLIFNSILL